MGRRGGRGLKNKEETRKIGEKEEERGGRE